MTSLLKSFIKKVSKVWMFLCTFFTKLWKCVQNEVVDKIDNGDILQQCEQEIQDLLEENEVVDKIDYGDGLHQCEQEIQDLLKENEVLNKKQCQSLFGKLSKTFRMIFRSGIPTNETALQFEPILQELYHVAKKLAMLVKDCGRSDWCRAAIFQLESKETFRELLLDLKCCYDATNEFCSIYDLEPMEDIDFDAATSSEVQHDQQILRTRLEQVLAYATFEDRELAKYLLQRLKDLHRVDGGELDDIEFPYDFKKPIVMNNIFHGNLVSVDQAKWMDLPCVVKTMKGLEEHFRKEAGILGGLRHPNIINFFSCGMDKAIEELYLVMEPMQKSLGRMLEEQKRPIPYLVAIDIMLQIARGMCYLHDMHIAHRDLKPDNVLLSSMVKETRGDFPHYSFVKLIDFGISKINVGSKPSPTETYLFGTKNYMAPEVIENKCIQPMDTTRLACPFEADVYSFAMTCSELITRQKPFSDVNRFNDLLFRIQKHERPTLPPDFEELNALIRDCWALNPSKRPTFSKICIQLMDLKKRFLVFNKSLHFDASTNISHDTWPKVPKDKQGGSIKLSGSPTEHEVIGAKENISKVRDCLKKVNILGIIGMGGIGKTTLAKFIFDETKSTFDASYLLGGLKSRSDCLEILHDILSNLGSDKNRIPKDLDHAQTMMKELLVKKRVLLILDDIKDQDQVDSIIPMDVRHVNNGTKVILTTRDWSAIKDCVSKSGKIDVDKLKESEAMELFTTHLFLDGGHLPTQFRGIAKEIVKACNGLPLSLKVMGAFLCGQERLRIWERALQRMTRGRFLDGDNEDSDTKLWGILRTSFDELKDKEKDIFLDIACFFCRDVYPIGMSKERALRIWTDNLSSPVDALETLVERSLVKVDQKDAILEVHDQLRDMGRMIIEKEPQYKGTRIWNVNMIPSNVFTSKDVKLQGIFYRGSIIHLPLDMGIQDCNLDSLRLLSSFDTNNALANFEKNCSLSNHSFRLKCLLIGHNSSEGRTCSDSKITTIANLWRNCVQLNVLQLRGCTFFKRLPIEIFSINTLLELDLWGCSSLTTLPKEIENLTSLTTLNLSLCLNLILLPKQVGTLTSLTTLDLSHCTSLITLPKEVGNLTSLIILYLTSCTSLTTLPEGMGNLTSLTILDLTSCTSLTTLPERVENLTSLKNLGLRDCTSLMTLPEGVGNLTSLTTLYLGGCTSLTTLPEGMWNLTSLNTLHLRHCTNLKTLSEGVGNLTALTTLYIGGCTSLTTLPHGLWTLTSLTTLGFRGCTSLTTLSEGVGNLTSLTAFHFGGCTNLTTIPEGVWNLTSLTTLDLRHSTSLTTLPEGVENLTSLITLYLGGCTSLTTLPEGVWNLTSLKNLGLRGCTSLMTLPKGVGNLTSLTTLYLGDCTSLTTLPEGVGKLTCLTILELKGCTSLTTLPEGVENLTSLTTLDWRHCTNLTTLPQGVGNLISLRILYFGGCTNLTTLPEGVWNLTSLKSLGLRGCTNLMTLPEGVGNLTSLITLYLGNCTSLTTLPEGVGKLTSLTILELTGCTSLTTLPEGVGNLTSLTSLDWRHCTSLMTLPQGVGNLTSLRTLYLEGCTSLTTLPEEVWNLTALKNLGLRGCTSLTTLPEGVGNLTSLTTLYLRDCTSLTTLPEGVGNLTCLQILELTGCTSLTTLPEGVENLTSLTTLDLRHCTSLMTLSEGVGNLASLKTLYSGVVQAYEHYLGSGT